MTYAHTIPHVGYGNFFYVKSLSKQKSYNLMALYVRSWEATGIPVNIHQCSVNCLERSLVTTTIHLLRRLLWTFFGDDKMPQPKRQHGRKHPMAYLPTLVYLWPQTFRCLIRTELLWLHFGQQKIRFLENWNSGWFPVARRDAGCQTLSLLPYFPTKPFQI